MALLASRSIPPSRPRALPWLIALGFALPGAVLAQSAAPSTQRVAALNEIVVSGSRTEQPKDDLPASIDVIDSQQLEQSQAQDMREAVRDIPNVSVRRAPARFGLAAGATGRDGNAGINIRGLDGNRVLILVDGIRQPRSYVFSANAFGRDYIDIGLVERIELIKGPASALYGSDGMAGLVNFITREPGSYLQGGKSFGGSATIGYSGDDNGKYVGATLAGRPSDAVEWLISGKVGRNGELKNRGDRAIAGDDRTVPNPETDRDGAFLGKLILRPNADQKHTLSFEHVQKHSDYDLLSGLTYPANNVATSVIGLNARNELKRDRLSWDGRLRLGAALADDLQAVASYQKSSSREYAFEDRRSAADRVRDTVYDENTLQLGLQAGKTLRIGDTGWAHKIIYGVDYVRTNVENLQTGLTPPAGESFPLKRFPDTRETSSAFYIQDEIFSDRWSITPGVRFDRFKLAADQAGFNAQAVSLKDSAVSPKLGVLYRFTPEWSAYGNYARGFKAPNAFQVNNFFENVTAGYKTIPNPDLKPERSENFELGLRARWANFNFDAAAFTGDYKDFIEDNRQVGGRGIPRIDPLIFQSVNIARARISGFEMKGEANFPLAGGDLLSVPFAYGQTRGRDRTSGQPLNSVDPRKASIGLKYQAPTWNVRVDAVYHAAKKLQDIDRSALPGAYYAIPSATTLDLSGQWRIRPDLRLNVAIVNLTNKKYWMWSDVRGGAVTATNIDAFTQAGRHLNVSLVKDF
ncbi:TonB-dependent hemoglobin/transferrin/lactoferrin family receptor [Variovorax sp. KK3]|uniref:TonB-dependent hemoglobin/transferrin/lactoferrin family receptor n=1 Tax=Variovorax sp. KK3 TaxID=1855728 RepID=UPI00097C3EDE|nr:TonB-dependent hemoglobin/transferrin/lactoferrin family receptor [Variovorax sp. KK3]